MRCETWKGGSAKGWSKENRVVPDGKRRQPKRRERRCIKMGGGSGPYMKRASPDPNGQLGDTHAD